MVLLQKLDRAIAVCELVYMAYKNFVWQNKTGLFCKASGKKRPEVLLFYEPRGQSGFI